MQAVCAVLKTTVASAMASAAVQIMFALPARELSSQQPQPAATDLQMHRDGGMELLRPPNETGSAIRP